MKGKIKMINKVYKEELKNIKIAESLAAVHTHTHTHTECCLLKNKIIIINIKYINKGRTMSVKKIIGLPLSMFTEKVIYNYGKRGSP